MFGTIRKHQTWLWAVIITLTIISFVIFFSPNSNFNATGPKPRFGSIHGEEITEEKLVEAQKEAMLQYFFMSGGQWPDNDAQRMGYDLERETYQWLLLLNRIDNAGIQISNDMAAEVGRNMISQLQRAGVSSAKVFADQVLAPRGLKMSDFERFVHHYLAIQEMVAMAGVGGKLVMPDEVKALWVRENQQLETQAVFLSASNFLAQINPAPEMLSMFYSNRLAQYRLPERLQVKYVEFPATNFWQLAEAELVKTNLDQVVDMNLERMGTNFTRFGATTNEARAKIREELIRNRALTEARRKATEFASELFDKTPASPENLDTLAQAKGFQVKLTEPFDRSEGPKDLDVSQNFTTSAFGMDLTNEPYAGPIVGQNGVYVLAFGRRLPSEIPSFDQVKDRVTNDYKEEQAAAMARSAGMAAHQAITNAIAQGKTFEAAASGLNLSPVTLPPLALSTKSLPGFEERANLNELKQIAFGTQPGQVSSFQATEHGGLILHVKSKLPVDEAKMAAELPTFLNVVRQNRQNEAFNEWFRREASVGLRDTPVGQPRTPPPSMSSAGPKKS